MTMPAAAATIGDNSLVDLAARISREHEARVSAEQGELEHAIAAGRLLAEAKQQFGKRGQWRQWVESNCSFAFRTAQAYMQIAKNEKSAEGSAHLSIIKAIKGIQAKKQRVEHAGPQEQCIERLNGHKRFNPRGVRIPVPDGMTLAELCRKGAALEANGASPSEAAKQCGIGVQSFTAGRSIVVLSDRKELSVEERKLVDDAIATMNADCRVRQPYASVKPIIDRVWGSRRGVRRTDKGAAKRVAMFKNAISIITEACRHGRDLQIPALDEEETTSAVASIRQSIDSLRALSRAITRGGK